MRESLKLSCNVLVTNDNLRLIKTVTPNVDVKVGDRYRCDYRVWISYFGDVAEKLEAMIELGSEPTTRDCQTMETILSRLFAVFRT